jgi:hypothetical protein
LKSSKSKTVTQTQVEDPILQGKSWDNFYDAIKPEASKKTYRNSLKRYMRHRKVSNPDDLLNTRDPIAIEDQIIDYVKWLKSTGIKYNAIHVQVSPIFTFF